MDKSQPKLSQAKLTIHLIATGLIKLSEQVGRGKPLRLPYPTSLQRGLDKLALEGVRQNKAIVQGIPALLDWCRQPFGEWPVALELEEIGPGDKLLEGAIPTAICEAWACLNPDVEAELSEQQLMLSVMTICRAAGKPESYTAFRRLLIERPVLTHFELLQLKADPLLYLLAEQIVESYQPAPLQGLSRDGYYFICQSCNNLLAFTNTGDLICEDETCRLFTGITQTSRNTLLAQTANKTINSQENVFWLKRGLRRFVTAPGRAELRLYHTLISLGLAVDLWPQFDVYDLRLTFPAGECWAIDVKDWANPFLLAQKVKPIPRQPGWDKAYFVFPDERLKERSDYLRAFVNHCPVTAAAGSRTEALFESSLVKAAQRKVTGGSLDAK